MSLMEPRFYIHIRYTAWCGQLFIRHTGWCVTSIYHQRAHAHAKKDDQTSICRGCDGYGKCVRMYHERN